MNRANDLFYYPVIGSVNSETVIEAFEDFATKMGDSKYSSNDRYTLMLRTCHLSKLLERRSQCRQIKLRSQLKMVQLELAGQDFKAEY